MATLASHPLILAGEGWEHYGLVDSGHGRKLERYGPYRFIRPEPQAMWSPRRDAWDAHGEFVPGSDEDGGGQQQQRTEHRDERHAPLDRRFRPGRHDCSSRSGAAAPTEGQASSSASVAEPGTRPRTPRFECDSVSWRR